LNQKEAVMDLVYNIGYARFKKSKAYTALKKGDLATFVYEAFDPQQGFVKAGGKILKGLQRRRLAEMQLFMSE
jgi:GH24 family phage-related lysozyme (muramidase)